MTSLGRPTPRRRTRPNRKHGPLLLAALAAVAAGICPPAAAQDRNYAIPEIRIAVEVREDGRVAVSETRLYLYDGAFSWANYRLPKAGFSAIRNIRVRDGDEALVNRNGERPGTFRVEASRDAIDVRWFYRAENERREFTVDYVLEDALTVGPEWSELFWTYAAAGREKPTERFEIAIELPDEVPADTLRAWARGPLPRIDLSTAAGRYEVTAIEVGADEPLTVRAVFPTAVLDTERVAVTDPDFSLEWAREDEAAFTALARQRAEMQTGLERTGRQLTALLALLSAGAFGLLYQHYGRRHPAPGTAEHAGLVMPPPIEPAAVGWLLDRQSAPRHVMATLLDLARRGYLRIEERVGGRAAKPKFDVSVTERAAGEPLQPWETSLLGFIRERTGGSAADLEKLFRQDASRTRKWFEAFKREVREHGRAQGWVDLRSRRGAWLNAAVQSVIGAVALVIAATLWPPALIAAAVAALGLVLSAAIPRRTPAGQSLHRRWSTYRKALGRAAPSSIDADQLGLHFVYAVAFGLRRRRVESLVEHDGAPTAALPWLVLHQSSTSPAAIAGAFVMLQDSGNAAFGAATGAPGVAGGAAAGSAGGGASGGAG